MKHKDGMARSGILVELPSRHWPLRLTVLVVVVLLVDTQKLDESEGLTHSSVLDSRSTTTRYCRAAHIMAGASETAFRVDGSLARRVTSAHLRGGSALPRVDSAERAEERKAERKNRSRKQRRKALQLERQAEAAMGKAIRGPNGQVFRPDPEFPLDEALVYLSEPPSDPEVGTYFSGPLSDVEDIPPDDRPLKVENGTSGRAVPWFGKPLATPDMQKSIRRLVQDLADAKQVCMGLRQVTHALKVAAADFIMVQVDGAAGACLRYAFSHMTNSEQSSESGAFVAIALAADTDPASILLPITELCIERELPFVWVPSRKALGAWCGVKAASSCFAVSKEVASHLKGQASEVRGQIGVLWRYSEPED